MTIDFGTGPTLQVFSPYLCNAAERHARILEVTERNSVIAGLPPFSEEFRAQLLQMVTEMDAEHASAPNESTDD